MRNRYQSGLFGMLVLAVAAPRADQLPAVPLQASDDFPAVHKINICTIHIKSRLPVRVGRSIRFFHGGQARCPWVTAFAGRLIALQNHFLWVRGKNSAERPLRNGGELAATCDSHDHETKERSDRPALSALFVETIRNEKCCFAAASGLKFFSRTNSRRCPRYLSERDLRFRTRFKSLSNSAAFILRSLANMGL